jgi:curved DNA-binding protein CbpA
MMRRLLLDRKVILALYVFLYISSFFLSTNHSIICLGDDSLDDDFLSEILAEEARHEEEAARMEAEAREYEAMQARQYSDGGGNANGKPKMGGAGRTMPKGASGGSFSKMEEELKKKEAERASIQAAKDEELQEQEAERIRLKREAAFEAELKKMNEEQKKKSLQQKKKDAKIVNRILKASKAGKHYSVLGIRNFEVQIGPYYVLNFSIGPLVLFRVKTKAIKRVYRNLARIVHPDKNKDGRAEEAFHALEQSAAILTDDKQRQDYDKKIIAARRRKNKHAVDSVLRVSHMAWSQTASTLKVTKKVLGPFSTPILVVGALIMP